MTNAQRLAREVATDILKAYNSKIFSSVATPEQRERAQAAAYIAAEKHIRGAAMIGGPGNEWLDEKAKEES